MALGPGRSAVAVGRLLLEHGADPNTGYLWEGLIPPFTALTGALGGGGTIPKHEQQLALARVLLEAGADANDGQALYNQGWGQDPQEDWLELLFAFGLGTGEGGRWRRLLGERQDSPRKMLEDLLIAAAGHGLTDRVRRLLARGVDPQGREPKHPIYQGRSPVQQAALNGHMDTVAVLVDAGATWEHDRVDERSFSSTAARTQTSPTPPITPPRPDGPSTTANTKRNSCSKYSSDPPPPPRRLTDRTTQSRPPSRERRCEP